MNIAKITTICLLMTVAITVTAQTKKTSMQDARKEALERAMKARKGESIDPTPIGSVENQAKISIEDVHRAAAPDAVDPTDTSSKMAETVVEEPKKLAKKEKKKRKKKKSKEKDIQEKIVTSESESNPESPIEEAQPYVITRPKPLSLIHI